MASKSLDSPFSAPHSAGEVHMATASFLYGFWKFELRPSCLLSNCSYPLSHPSCTKNVLIVSKHCFHSKDVSNLNSDESYLFCCAKAQGLEDANISNLTNEFHLCCLKGLKEIQ